MLVAAALVVFGACLWGYNIFGINLGHAFLAAIVTTTVVVGVIANIIDRNWFDRWTQDRRLRMKETRFSLLKRKHVPSRQCQMIDKRTDPSQFFDHPH